MLHYYQDKSYQEIAQLLGITYDNVRLRMSQARAILRYQEQLRECVGEEDGVLRESGKGRKSKKGKGVEPAVGESLALPSLELDEVKPVGGGEPVGAVLEMR